jgi:hypothetical protein
VPGVVETPLAELLEYTVDIVEVSSNVMLE